MTIKASTYESIVDKTTQGNGLTGDVLPVRFSI